MGTPDLARNRTREYNQTETNLSPLLNHTRTCKTLPLPFLHLNKSTFLSRQQSNETLHLISTDLALCQKNKLKVRYSKNVRRERERGRGVEVRRYRLSLTCLCDARDLFKWVRLLISAFKFNLMAVISPSYLSHKNDPLN